MTAADAALDATGGALELARPTALAGNATGFERFTLGGAGKNVLAGGGDVAVLAGTVILPRLDGRFRYAARAGCCSASASLGA